MPRIDISLEELHNSYDWEEVFGEGSGGNCDKERVDPCPPTGKEIDLTPPYRKDVKEVIAAVNGEKEEDSWIGVFLLHDGRYLVAGGWCDYTGWECQASNYFQIGATLEDVIQFGLTPEDRERLKL